MKLRKKLRRELEQALALETVVDAEIATYLNRMLLVKTELKTRLNEVWRRIAIEMDLQNSEELQYDFLTRHVEAVSNEDELNE
jgi:hypothetical protein